MHNMGQNDLYVFSMESDGNLWFVHIFVTRNIFYCVPLPSRSQFLFTRLPYHNCVTHVSFILLFTSEYPLHHSVNVSTVRKILQWNNYMFKIIIEIAERVLTCCILPSKYKVKIQPKQNTVYWKCDCGSDWKHCIVFCSLLTVLTWLVAIMPDLGATWFWTCCLQDKNNMRRQFRAAI